MFSSCINILTFITSIDLTGGGPSRSVPMFVKGLEELGVEVTLMTMLSEQMNSSILEGTSAKIQILESFDAKEVEEYLKSEKFDIIQIQSIWDIRYHKLIKIARKLNIPYIITPRGMLEPWSLSHKKWKKKLAMLLYQKKDLQRAACIYTTASMEAKHVHELGIDVPCSVIPNGIETEAYPCRTRFDVVKKQVLFLSRIHIKKGIEILIDAWNEVQQEYIDWNLLIVGNGEQTYIEHLKQKVKNMGLTDSIEIKEAVFGQSKTDLYQSSALFVLPSYSENFGMVVAEALSCGVPVITSDNTPWKILNDTNTGWCITLSTNNIADKIRQAMNMDSHELYEMGQKGSKLIYNEFHYLNCAIKCKALYEWILTGGKKPDFVV